MAYKIELTDEERDHLGWLTDRGYFPDIAFREMHLADGQPEWDMGVYPPNRTTRTWQIPEHAAWSILEAREEDPYALFNCTGGPLLEKLLALEASIV